MSYECDLSELAILYKSDNVEVSSSIITASFIFITIIITVWQSLKRSAVVYSRQTHIVTRAVNLIHQKTMNTHTRMHSKWENIS